MSDYKYVGDDCAFCDYGDIFELTRSGKGYIHIYDRDNPRAFTCLPKDRVEESCDFVELNEQLDEFVSRLKTVIKEERKNPKNNAQECHVYEFIETLVGNIMDDIITEVNPDD